MAFEGEFASYKPLARILDNEKIDALNRRMSVRPTPNISASDYPNYVNINTMSNNVWIPDMVLAIDGSSQSVPVNNGFPGAEIGYVTVAAVLILMDKVRQIDKKQFIDPKALRETEKASAFDALYPGCNVIVDDAESARCSLRQLVFEQLKEASPCFSGFESLLDTYEALLHYRSQDSKLPAHQLEELEQTEEMEFGIGTFKSKKPGYEDRTLYSTDALRLHELLNNSGASGELYGQIYFFIERLLLVHILRGFERKNWLGTLKNVAFVLDGSLAVYSVSAWIATAIKKEIQRINDLQKKINGTDLAILGIEKSGRFMEHFNLIDTSITGEDGIFPSRSALLLDDAYIKKNIIFSKSSKPYGQQTYFGRKFFYKTANGYRLVVQTPYLNSEHSDLSKVALSQFPRIHDICGLLDQLVSNRYPHSISPLVSAHAEAAIPLSLGSKLFEKIVAEMQKRGY